LNSLAVLYYYIGDHARAEMLFQRALAVWEAIPGAEDVVAIALNNFAATCRDAGDYARAETLFLRALSVWEKKMGTEHWNEATFLVGLAKLYTQTGDYSKAEPLFWRALTVRSKTFSPNHPEVIKAYDHLIRFYLLKGDAAQPVALQTRLNSLLEQNIALNLAVGSEQQKLAYLSSLPAYLDRTISLHVGFAPHEATARDLAVTTLLQRKGRVLDAMTDSWATLRRRFEPRHQALLEELSKTVAQLARVVLNESSRPQTEDHRRLTASLEEKRARLEAEISRRSMEGRAQLQPVTLAAVQAAIPPATALLEFGVYRPFDPQAVNNKTPFGQPRYVVYVVTRQGEAQWEELGEAKTIDEEISKLRLALRDPKRTDVLQLARAVDEKIMQPIRPLLGDATQLLISPDGALALIPFEVMVDERGKYLIERYSISYVTSGRDLLRMQVARASQSKPLVLANPLFGEPEFMVMSKEGTKTPQRVSFQRKQKRGTKRQSVTTGADLSTVYFAPLGGTAREAKAIKSLFAEASVLTGTQATESSLKQAAAPRFLHIATHGFFVTDTPSPSSNINGENTRAINAKVKIENPLLRSGLALAGANLHKSSEDDGILTALEASGLNLWGTKLVTLSACDTGLGEVKNGEGVYGLRRAFVLAGTETLVMSLWPVSDQVTREMMIAYYAGLRQGQGRGEALRRVKLNMLKRREQEHPFYWASFIQAGEWANLDGQR
jgi:CHAT domain-containing protein